MPSYDFRCKACGERFSLRYPSVAAYDAAQQSDTPPACPHCAATDLARIITRVNVKTPSRDYSRMSSGEMLSVFESGDSRAVGEMFQQVGAGDPALGSQYHDATQRLLKGDSMDKVERDLSASPPDSGSSASTAPPSSAPKTGDTP